MAKFLKLVALTSVIFVLAACAKLPSILTNQLGPQVVTSDKNESLYYSPSSPVTGSTQEQILDGFLYAGNGPQDDYAVARKYLTIGFSPKWNPAQETLIQNGENKIVSNTGTKIRLLVHFDAKVNQDGTYEQTPGSSRILEFHLLQESGQWRIALAPDLTILLQPNFNVLFKALPVFFWDKSLAYLVPDVRWFPTKASLATRLTNALIAGPTSWVQPAVQNLLPAGTKLNINSVTISGGLASVDLNANALKLPTWRRPYLRSQLLATLGGIDGVTRVNISLERSVPEVPQGPSGMPGNTSNLPVLLTKNGLSHIAGTALFEIRGTKQIVVDTKATAFAISGDETLVALLGKGSVYSYSLGLLTSKLQVIDARTGLLQPTIDAFNGIWSASSTSGAFIRVTSPNGTQVSIANPYGNSVSIRQLAVSPEGSRLAIVHDTLHGTSVDLFPIVRDANRKVVSLGSPITLGDFGPNTDTISWVDHINLDGISRDSTGHQQTVSDVIGGASIIGRPTFDATAIVTTVGGSQYYLNREGTLFASKGLGWEQIQTNILGVRMAGQ